MKLMYKFVVSFWCKIGLFGTACYISIITTLQKIFIIKFIIFFYIFKMQKGSILVEILVDFNIFASIGLIINIPNILSKFQLGGGK